MATDYDTPRKTDDDVDSDSLEELKARRNDKSTSAVDVDELQRRLKLSGSRTATVVLTRASGKPWMLVCFEPSESGLPE